MKAKLDENLEINGKTYEDYLLLVREGSTWKRLEQHQDLSIESIRRMLVALTNELQDLKIKEEEKETLFFNTLNTISERLKDSKLNVKEIRKLIEKVKTETHKSKKPIYGLSGNILRYE